MKGNVTVLESRGCKRSDWMKKRGKELACLAAIFCAAVVGGTASNTLESSADNMKIKVGELTVTVPEKMLVADVTSFLNVRLQPSSSSTVIAELKPGDSVEYVGQTGNWTEVSIDGQIGYVFTKYTKTGTGVKKYIKNNLDSVDITGSQTEQSYQAVYKTKKAAREDAATYTIDGKAKTDAVVYATKSSSHTISNQYEKVEKAYVEVDGLRFRGKPSKSSTIYTVFSKGTTLDIVSEKNPEWLKVKYNGKTGYVSRDYLKKVKVKVKKSNKAGQLEKNEKVVVSAVLQKWVKVQDNNQTGYVKREDIKVSAEKAASGSAVVGFMENKTKYEILDVQKDLVFVKLADGTKGYTKASTVKANVAYSDVKVDKAAIAAAAKKTDQVIINDIKDVSATRKKIVEYALQFKGNRYVWGGNSLTNGVDCSGFTQQIYKKFGVNLARCSYAQAKNGKEIAFEDLKPGDLIFYYNKNLKRIGHVALYIGDNQIIHAQSKRTGIVVSKWNYNTPYKAVNVLGD